MRPTVPPDNTRSLALQQYDEAKRNAAAVGNSSISTASSKPKVVAAATSKPPRRLDDDWTLCGWQDEPSVPAAARVASAKLVRHQPASSPSHPPSTHQTNSNSSSRQRRAAVAGSNSSPARRPQQGTTSPTKHSKISKRQTYPAAAARRLQLGEEDSFGAAAEHYRPPGVAQAVLGSATPESAALGATPAATDAAVGGSSGPFVCEASSGNTSAGCAQGSNASCLLLPRLRPRSLQQQQQHPGFPFQGSIICQAPTAPLGSKHEAACGFDQLVSGAASDSAGAAADNSAIDAGAEDTIDNDDDDDDDSCDADDLATSLYAPRGSSRGTAGLLLPRSSGRTLLTRSTSSINSNIIALQQRLLLHQTSYGPIGSRGMSGGSRGPAAANPQVTTTCLSEPTAAAAAAAAGPGMRPDSAGGHTGAGTAQGFCLHARMATTAARAQMLLTRDLSTMLTPHTPRTRAAHAGTLLQPWPQQQEGSQGGVSASSIQTVLPVQHQGDPAAAAAGGAGGGGSSLRFVNSSRCGSRPSSAARARGASSDTQVLVPAGSTVLATMSCSLSGPDSSTRTSGSVLPRQCSRRPLSATRAGAGRHSSGGSDGSSGSSGRPSTSGSTLGEGLSPVAAAPSGSSCGPALCPSRGLTAAAEYMACRVTVGELLQRIKCQKAAAGVQPARSSTSIVPGARLAPVQAASSDNVHSSSRDIRPAACAAGAAASFPGSLASKQPAASSLPVQPSALQSLKAYQQFQADTAACGSIRQNRTGFVKSVSSGGSSRFGGGGNLELRATAAALRKCGSSK